MGERWASNLDNRGQSTTSHQNQLRLFLFFFFQSDSTKHFGVILFLSPFFSWLIAARHPSTPLFFCRQLAWQPRVTSSAKTVAPARCLSIYVCNWNKGGKKWQRQQTGCSAFKWSGDQAARIVNCERLVRTQIRFYVFLIYLFALFIPDRSGAASSPSHYLDSV